MKHTQNNEKETPSTERIIRNILLSWCAFWFLSIVHFTFFQMNAVAANLGGLGTPAPTVPQGATEEVVVTKTPIKDPIYQGESPHVSIAQ